MEEEVKEQLLDRRPPPQMPQGLQVAETSALFLNEDPKVRDLLESVGLGRCRELCAEEEIDLEALSFFGINSHTTASEVTEISTFFPTPPSSVEVDSFWRASSAARSLLG